MKNPKWWLVIAAAVVISGIYISGNTEVQFWKRPFSYYREREPSMEDKASRALIEYYARERKASKEQKVNE